MSSKSNLMASTLDAINKIDSSKTENEMQYYFGKSIAYAEIMYFRGLHGHEYLQIISDINNLVNCRRARGFAQTVGEAS